MTIHAPTGTPQDQLARWVSDTGQPPRIGMTGVRTRHRGHFFDPAALRFFDSRIGSTAYALPNGGAVFTTSEQCRHGDGSRDPRRYTVRVQSPDGDIMLAPCRRPADPSEPLEYMPGHAFQAWPSSTGARRAARRFALLAWLDPSYFAPWARAGRVLGWDVDYIAAALGLMPDTVAELLELDPPAVPA